MMKGIYSRVRYLGRDRTQREWSKNFKRSTDGIWKI